MGQVAVVTGAASGIGAAVAARFSAEGARVALLDRDDSQTQPLVAEQQRPFRLDVSSETQVDATFAEIASAWGQIDIVVHCAGIVGPTSTPILDYELGEFRRVLDINLVGSFLITKAALRHMVPRRYGRVLLVASIAGKDGNPGMAGYTASKAGLIGLVKGIGKEYAQAGITVNGLAPAVIATPMNAKTAPAMLEYMTDKIPMKRLGTVEEAAAICCWICSAEASFNTGFVFDLSGGRATY